MGAIIDYKRLSVGNLTLEQISSAWADAQDTDAYVNGHDPYSGTVQTLTGLLVHDTVYASIAAYEAMLNECARKYGPAIAAQVMVAQCLPDCPHRRPDKNPRYQLCRASACIYAVSVPCWYAGGLCPS